MTESEVPMQVDNNEGDSADVHLPGIIGSQVRCVMDAEPTPQIYCRIQIGKCMHGVFEKAKRIGVTKNHLRVFFHDSEDYNDIWVRNKFVLAAMVPGSWMRENWAAFYRRVPHYVQQIQNGPLHAPPSYLGKRFMLALYWVATSHDVQWENINVRNTGEDILPMYTIDGNAIGAKLKGLKICDKAPVDVD